MTERLNKYFCLQHCWNRTTLIYVFLVILIFFYSSINGQSYKIAEPAIEIYQDSLNKKRLFSFVGISSATYVAGSVVLYQTWYKDYPQSSFHFHDDSREWLQMDKVGHIFGSYQQSLLLTKGFQWTGLPLTKSRNFGMLGAFIFQSTVEMMDGFSEPWGFSLTDLGSNLIGIGAFGLQERLWKEQRITFKFSYSPKVYSTETLLYKSTTFTLSDRAQSLYGRHFAQQLLKDYNAQTYWASININEFIQSPLPDWLNIAVGYGADHLYGGFENQWDIAGKSILLDPEHFPRSRQYYLSLDLNTDKIKTNSKLLRTILDIFNFIKIPFPALELHSNEGLKFHPVKF